MREGFFIWKKCRNLNNKNRLRRLCINLPHTSGSPRIICRDFKNTNKETQKKSVGTIVPTFLLYIGLFFGNFGRFFGLCRFRRRVFSFFGKRQAQSVAVLPYEIQRQERKYRND